MIRSLQSPRVIIAPDSFKGSLDAPAVAQALAKGLRQTVPDADIELAPMADGGEGTLDCIAAACAGGWRWAKLIGVHGRSISAAWFCGDDGTAYIEAAAVLGLPLIANKDQPPSLWHRSSAPLAVLMREALTAGCKSLVIGLGGSACNDAGLGLLTELGLIARDADGGRVGPNLAGLMRLDHVDYTAVDAHLTPETRIQVLCDVDNPLCGEHGATQVYAPQKGIQTHELAAVDTAFAHFATLLGAEWQASLRGAGAAGGLGFALTVLGGNLEPGAKSLLELTGLTSRLADADFVITGEGKTDAQTFSGKTPFAVAQAARPRPTFLVSGQIANEVWPSLVDVFSICYCLVEQSGSLEKASASPVEWLAEVGAQIGYDWMAQTPSQHE